MLWSQEGELPPPNVKAEFNTNYATWRLLGKHLTDFMRKECGVIGDACLVSLDEMAECSIFDAVTMKDRSDIVKKKIRKVYEGRPIYVRFRMRNTLLTEVSISNLKLEAHGVQFSAMTKDINFKGKDEVEITLQVTPEASSDVNKVD
jgi:hypothetical protein